MLRNKDRGGVEGVPMTVRRSAQDFGRGAAAQSSAADAARRLIRACDRATLATAMPAGSDNALTGPRVTVLGRIAPSEDPADRARFLARHPSAALYADFADFRFYRVAVERAHLVAGFGRIDWVDAAALLFDAGGASALA